MYDNINMNLNKTHIFTLIAFAVFTITTPRLCAQSMDAQKNMEQRTTFSQYGKKFLGCPYVSGAIGPNQFDCSGLVYTVARESIGYQLPRQVKNMYKFCKIITDDQRQQGDLVFFKTTGTGEVSHVGIYMGRNQFLHCASDGPNNGVILSSLNESYWKGKYYKSGRFLPDGEPEKKEIEKKSAETTGSAVKSNMSATQASSGSSSSFLSRIFIDSSFGLDWNFFDSENVRLNFKGINAQVHARYQNGNFQPGVGTSLRWDTSTGTLQLPFIVSLTMGEYFQIFAGPVICLGTPALPGNSGTQIQSSFFPGIMGVCWNTPSFTVKKAKVCFAQDLHYTVFNKTDGSALSPIDSLGAGFGFSSSIRVTLPLSQLL